MRFSISEYLDGNNFLSNNSSMITDYIYSNKSFYVKDSLNFEIIKLCGSVITEINIIEISGTE